MTGPTPGTQQTTDPFLNIAMGLSPGKSYVNKFGRNTSVSTAQEDVWDGGGTYIWPSSASITHIKASTDSAATRNKTIEVQGLDTNGNLVTQTATTDATNSTTEVALTTALWRCFRMKNTSGTDFDQNIVAGPTGFATTQAQITAGFNQTLMALYTIPAGKTGYLVNVWSSMNRAGGSLALLDIILWSRSENGVFRVQRTDGLLQASSTLASNNYGPYPSYAEKTDLKMTAQRTGGTDADVSAGFDLILADN